MDQNESQNTNQQPTTQPADNGDQGSGKMFTQEEVNNIVRDRLARERAKAAPQEPTEEEKRAKDLTARENRVSCREYVIDQGLPAELLDVLDTSDHEEFKKKADIVSGMLKASKPTAKAENPALVEMKRRIALEKGIPPVLADRLTGETESDIYQDAAVMQGIIRHIKGPAPLADLEYSTESGMPEGFKKTKHIPKQY